MTDGHDEALTVVTGEGAPAELRAAVVHVRDCASCQAALARMGQSLDRLMHLAAAGATMGRLGDSIPASGFLSDGTGPFSESSLRRLLERARAGRLSYFVDDVAELFDLSHEAAAELLARAERDEGWEEGPAPGVLLMPVTCGPKVPEAMTALVKLVPGAQFPEHPHFGPERVVVLEGGYRDSLGTEVWRGESHDMSAGTEHSFVALDGIGCVCASVSALMPG